MQSTSRQVVSPSLEAVLDSGVLTGDWVLDPRKSTIRLKARVVWGLIPVIGVFGEVTGSGRVSSDGDVTGTVTVAAASISTKSSRRDKHLRSTDFLDSARYPDIIFTVDGARPSRERVAVSGSLTVRDRTRSVSFDAAAFVRGEDEIHIDAEVRINRADFGVSWNRLGAVSLNSTITIRAVFTRGER
jgi:polyisoprenoid-binding protein YceI